MCEGVLINKNIGYSAKSAIVPIFWWSHLGHYKRYALYLYLFHGGIFFRPAAEVALSLFLELQRVLLLRICPQVRFQVLGRRGGLAGKMTQLGLKLVKLSSVTCDFLLTMGKP